MASLTHTIYIYIYIRIGTGRCVFWWDRLLDEGLRFCSTGSSLVFWWRDPPLVREFQMWGRRCKKWWNLVNHIVITFHDIFSSTDLNNFYFTRLHLHAVYKTWLTLSLPVDNSQQPMALKWNGGSFGLVSTVFFRKIYDLRIDRFFSFH